MGDLFHESVPFEWINEVIGVAVECHWHIFQILTKRADRMKEYFDQPNLWTDIIPKVTHKYLHHKCLSAHEPSPGYFAFNAVEHEYKSPIPNIWLGVTAENMRYVVRRKTWRHVQ